MTFGQLTQAQKKLSFELHTENYQIFGLSKNHDCVVVESVMPVEAPVSRGTRRAGSAEHNPGP